MLAPFLLHLLLVFGITDTSRAQDPALRRPAAASYDLVALRVEFQPDTTRFTTGDGTFDGDLYGDGLAPAVDPLPHDAAYFEAHLDFLKDYVARVSDGQTTITSHLLPDIIRVSQPMGAYSPTGPTADSPAERAKLHALVEEAWQLADVQLGIDIALDPARTVFVLFHAGVGRDVELIGTTLDKTPQDLPSLALTGNAFTEAFPSGLSFNGIPLTNTLIIPRTETRRAFDFVQDEPFLLELSINGLLAASFFNALGVPDLFNTETGETAIGAFGLMDPNGIFAYRGLFPPEPMAWTRYFLGWTEPYEIDSERTVMLTATSLPESAEAARVPVSGAEYFLVENRHRDPEGDGLVLRVWQNGEIVEQRVQNGDENFNELTIDGFIGGVVVGVDNYDWALPGGLLRNSRGEPQLDENGNTIPLNGGMLIWHIDERRLLDGSVNRDPHRRAIDLEEADSAEDLGFDAPAAIAGGSPFDFWYEGNPITAVTAGGQEVRLYENRFGPDTDPDSDTNVGGPSFVVLEDFSEPSVAMTFTYRRAVEEGVAPTLHQPLPFEVGDGGFITAAAYREGRVITTYSGSPINPFVGENTLMLPLDAVSHRPDQELALGNAPAILNEGEAQAAELVFSSIADRELYIFFWSIHSVFDIDNTTFNGINETNAFSGIALTTPIVAPSDQAVYVGLQANEGGYVLEARRSVEEPIVSSVKDLLGLAADGRGDVLIVRRSAVSDGAGDALWTLPSTSGARGQPAFGRDASGLVGVVPIVSENALLWLLADGTTQRFDLAPYAPLLRSDTTGMNRFPVLADLDDDRRLDVLTTVGRSLVAFTQGGALVEGFPIELEAGSVAQPLVAKLTDSGGWSVVVAALDGNLYAFDTGRRGDMVPGFPLAVGASVQATPLLQDKKLYAVSVKGELKAWQIDNLGDIWWGQLYANAQNTSYVELDAGPDPEPSAGGGLLVEAETYNWPNPVRDGRTFLRCMTRDDARVEVTIIDSAGSLVGEMNMELHGGTPAEHLWETEAPSGLYFARIKAIGADGETDSRVVKMAIVR